MACRIALRRDGGRTDHDLARVLATAAEDQVDRVRVERVAEVELDDRGPDAPPLSDGAARSRCRGRRRGSSGPDRGGQGSARAAVIPRTPAGRRACRGGGAARASRCTWGRRRRSRRGRGRRRTRRAPDRHRARRCTRCHVLRPREVGRPQAGGDDPILAPARASKSTSQSHDTSRPSAKLSLMAMRSERSGPAASWVRITWVKLEGFFTSWSTTARPSTSTRSPRPKAGVRPATASTTVAGSISHARKVARTAVRFVAL